jgi:undecaprenyl-diphosphatase
MPARNPAVRARLIALTCLAFFVVGGLGRFALAGALTDWDQSILDQIAGARTPWVTTVMRTLSLIGAGEGAIPVGLLVAWLLYRRHDRQAARCYVVTVLSGWALSLLLKVGFQRPRPAILPHLDGAGGYSYPSGHAMVAPLVFAFGAMLLARGRSAGITGLWWAAGWTLALTIAFSRLYLAVHYPSDVVAAVLAGTGWAALGVVVYSPLDRHPGGAAAPP